ncbi:MAG: FtsW/RodA/SpoVE family cell cycle protein [Lachnospiraceae bacterium]|nr:FtsW/RodA/SpoVE family cell cycle protein [Lachnospiraceae bacterium]
MGSFISEISNYAFVVIMALYVMTNIIVFFFKNPEKHKHFYMFQTLLAIAFHAVGYITLFMRTEDPRYFFFFAFQEIILFALILVFRTIYRSVSRLMLNNVIMLLFVGFTILGRLAFMNAVRQFVITVVALAVSMIIPWIMYHTKFVKKIGYVYCATGIIALGAVWMTGEITNGSKLAFTIEGMSFQPSEFVKISLVFFVAALLSNKKDPYRYISTALFSVVHILILVLSRDLGGAGIYCMIYLFMLYISNRNVLTLVSGALLGAGAFYLALQMFSHVKIRVQNWLNPWTDMSNTGYQITQSLFAIGTGGWEGMGLLQGDPTTIPYVNEDFVFSAIAEEFGVMFSILLILLYLVTVLHMFRMSCRAKEFFHKLLLSGFAVSLGTQVILTIGGGTRFIPLTGVTLPLISMGGSSLSATLLMFGVIQGIYIKEFAYYEDHDDEEYDEYDDEFDNKDDELCEDEFSNEEDTDDEEELFVNKEADEKNEMEDEDILDEYFEDIIYDKRGDDNE